MLNAVTAVTDIVGSLGDKISQNKSKYIAKGARIITHEGGSFFEY